MDFIEKVVGLMNGKAAQGDASAAAAPEPAAQPPHRMPRAFRRGELRSPSALPARLR